MKQKIVGSFYLGLESVELVLREGTGGEYFMTPEKGHIARIKIGAEEKKWEDLVSVLLHELDEFVLDRLHCRLMSTSDLSQAHDGYVFHFNHQQLSEKNARIAEFLCAALPELSTAWKKFKPKQTK